MLFVLEFMANYCKSKTPYDIIAFLEREVLHLGSEYIFFILTLYL